MPFPTLVLLPGMDGTGDLFAPLLAQLPMTLKVQVIRYPRDQIAGYRELTEFVQRQLPVESDYVLLGESFSGPIAIELAVQAPRRLRGLILGCSFASSPQPQLRLLAAMARLMPMQIATSMIAMRILLGRHANHQICAMLQQAIRSVPRAILSARLREIAAVDVRDKFRSIQLPVLYLRANDDTLVPASIAHHLQQLQPAMQIAEIDGPHFLLQTQAAAAAAAILRFLSDIKSAASSETQLQSDSSR